MKTLNGITLILAIVLAFVVYLFSRQHVDMEEVE